MPETITSNTPAKSYITLVKPKHRTISATDNALVALSSLFFVGGVVWIPSLYIWLYRKWRTEENKKRRKVYYAILVTATFFGIFGPHRNRKVAKLIDFKNWRIIKAWCNYLAYEVISEVSEKKDFNLKRDQAIFAVIPHGIVPVPLALATLPQEAHESFGEFRPVVASATRFLPGLKTVMGWMGSIDASKSAIEKALSKGERIGLSPGGIAEMFENFPKPNRSRNEECVILKSRKGFVRMALKNNIPLVPIYCFGGSKTFRRLQLPSIVEKLSNFLRMSIVIFFGKYGLPIPLQKKLLYVLGEPIRMPKGASALDENSAQFRDLVDKVHKEFCDELTRMFERNKHRYGWGHKRLLIV
mmetsp:Transcript_4766/g.7011  ORF Transcript_4766/g.7011 Transcript_4766/m.7011 type:complete len:357 (-) Transcript_4766:67-1137(-)